MRTSSSRVLTREGNQLGSRPQLKNAGNVVRNCLTRIPPMAGKKTVYISSRNLCAQRTRGSGCKRKSLCLGESSAVIPGSQLQGWVLTASFGESRVQHREQRPSLSLSASLTASRPSSFSLPPPAPPPCCLEMGSDRPSPLPIPLSAAPARVHARLSRGRPVPEVRSFGTRADRAGCEGGRSLTGSGHQEAWLWQWLCCVALGKSLSVSGPHFLPSPKTGSGS